MLDNDAVVVADPGTPCPYVSAFFEIRTEGRTLFSYRAHGALGYAMSAAMGAWVGRPDKQVVSLMGDGSFAFTCGELETVVRKKMPIILKRKLLYITCLRKFFMFWSNGSYPNLGFCHFVFILFHRA